MIHPKIFLRLIYISWILVIHGLDEIVLQTHLFRPIRFLVVFSPYYWLSKKGNRSDPPGVRIRQILEELGPIWVKFGQALSTRKDLLPEDIADELVKLQDKVPPFSSDLAKAVIEKELGISIEEAFAEFDPKPLASASVAQVHTATLHSGQKVVVKVLRPDIEERIHSDMALMFELAHWAEKFWLDAKRLRAMEVVAEFERTTLDELDLIREAANAAKIRRNFEHSEIIYIPEVHWPLTRQKVMVMERIYGIPVGDIKQLQTAGVDFKLLAERGVEIFFTQVFRDNFFHADMHPGNIFVDPPARYIAIDFGIVGSLSQFDQHYLAENFMAFFNRDYRKVAEMHVESGWVPRTTRIEEFESAIRSVCEPIFEKPLKDISFGQLLLRLFQTARRFDMRVQPQLVLLQKTLLNIEGLGRDLYPDLDLWRTAKPFMEKWFEERMGPKAKFTKLIKQLPELAEQLPELPQLIHKALDNAAHSHHLSERHTEELTLLRERIDNNHSKMFWAVLFAAALISAAIFFK